MSIVYFLVLHENAQCILETKFKKYDDDNDDDVEDVDYNVDDAFRDTPTHPPPFPPIKPNKEAIPPAHPKCTPYNKKKLSEI